MVFQFYLRDITGKHQRLREFDGNMLENNESHQSIKRLNKSRCFVLCILFVGFAISFTGLAWFVYLLYGSGQVAVRNADNEKVVSCYYNTPDPGQPNQLLPANIDPFLCTHINIAFAKVVNKQIHLDDSQYTTIKEVVNLKHQNPKLKVILSVGGSGNDDGFSEMVVDHASRKIFIKSIKQILRDYRLDGVDLDWEFPAMSLNSQLNHRERQHFSQLLREIRMEYIREKRDYLLTIAAAAPEVIVDVSYDIDQINTYVDYVNIMTYDFHYYTTFTPFTGFNSPLYARPSEHLYLETLNINYTVHMYMKKGLDSRKIVMGIPTYGHTFQLVNADNADVGSPASGFGALGSMGFVNFPDVCLFLSKNKAETTLRFDESAKVPYLFMGREWVSFDYPRSATDKARYIVEHNLRGAMVYSLNADDYRGVCGAGREGNLTFPLLQSVRNTLNSTNIGEAETSI